MGTFYGNRTTVPLDDQRTEICVIAPKIFSSAVGETEMIADPKRKLHQDDGDSDKRRRQEEALDDALKNTFPASDPVSVEQPTPPAADRDRLGGFDFVSEFLGMHARPSSLFTITPKNLQERNRRIEMIAKLAPVGLPKTVVMPSA